MARCGDDSAACTRAPASADPWPGLTPRAAATLLFTVSVLLALLFLNPFIGHWDSYDYMKYILTEQRSSLMLGRPYFIAYNVALYRAVGALGVPPSQAYLVVKLGIVLCSGLTSVMVYRFFSLLVAQRQALIGAALVALSPVFVVYGGVVMTEVPMMLALFSGLYCYQRGLLAGRFALLALGCGLVGVAAGIREQALALAPYLFVAPLLVRRRPRAPWRISLAWLVGLIAFAAGPLVLLLGDADYLPNIQRWLGYMSEQKARHPVGFGNVVIWLKWLVANQPIAVLAAVSGARLLAAAPRRHLAACGFVALSAALLLLLLGYQDLLYSPRYLMIGVPGLALAAGVALDRIAERVAPRTFLRAFAAAHAVLLVAAFLIMLPYRPTFAKAKRYHQRLRGLPATSVFMVGQYCPYISYLKAIGYPATWDNICAGWTWPGARLRATIDRHLRAGRSVFVDTDPDLWRGARMLRDLRDWQAIARHYRLTPTAGTLKRVRCAARSCAPPGSPRAHVRVRARASR